MPKNNLILVSILALSLVVALGQPIWAQFQHMTTEHGNSSPKNQHSTSLTSDYNIDDFQDPNALIEQQVLMNRMLEKLAIVREALPPGLETPIEVLVTINSKGDFTSVNLHKSSGQLEVDNDFLEKAKGFISAKPQIDKEEGKVRQYVVRVSNKSKIQIFPLLPFELLTNESSQWENKGGKVNWAEKYTREVFNRVQEHWEFEQSDFSRTFTTKMIFEVLADGESTNIKVINSSGDKGLDALAVKTLQMAGPFPPFRSKENNTLKYYVSFSGQRPLNRPPSRKYPILLTLTIINSIKPDISDSHWKSRYLSSLVSDVEKNWLLPYSRPTPKQVTYDVLVGPQGNLIRAVLKNSSGNSEFDSNALNALRKSEPFMPFSASGVISELPLRIYMRSGQYTGGHSIYATILKHGKINHTLSLRSGRMSNDPPLSSTLDYRNTLRAHRESLFNPQGV